MTSQSGVTEIDSDFSKGEGFNNIIDEIMENFENNWSSLHIYIIVIIFTILGVLIFLCIEDFSR